jgi:LmbE family N-acetylglucosaminyl deacetylase
MKDSTNSVIELLGRNIDVSVPPGSIIKAQNIMILAPHQDDEVLGCGGTILRYLEYGAEVEIVYITDGRYGAADSKNGIRRAEAQEAWERFNVNQIFLDYEDSHISEEAIQKIKELLQEFKPEIVFTPWPLDNHPDHKNTSLFLEKALNDIPSYNLYICMYEALYPLYANRIVNITKQYDRKIEILSKFKSQLGYLNLIEITKELSSLRAALLRLRSVKAAEAFMMLDKSDYIELVEKVFF